MYCTDYLLSFTLSLKSRKKPTPIKYSKGMPFLPTFQVHRYTKTSSLGTHKTEK